jgi:gamma-glutamylcyclotransferase (GGCT)/AIG2-like uncharacterized protein YtfP
MAQLDHLREGVAREAARTMENLFSYGTLRETKVQEAVFGRRVEGRADAVVGYRLVPVTITDERAIAISGRPGHTILEETGNSADAVEGVVFALSVEDIARADAYEDAAYKRAALPLRSGGNAWVYVKA